MFLWENDFGTQLNGFSTIANFEQKCLNEKCKNDWKNLRKKSQTRKYCFASFFQLHFALITQIKEY